MSKLYLFGIGGTGSRVIRSLTMLLAAGVEIKADEIIPVIIDPDKANGDVTRTVTLLKTYKKVREKLTFSNENKNRFFSTVLNNVTQDFRFNIDEVDNAFKESIGYFQLAKEDRALVELLFTEKNLNLKMSKGFKGNPNIGSVVLNQFYQKEEFIDIASSFQPDDKIFIISSIFGGTGAAGFPLLVKNFRNADPNMPAADAIKNAVIGAISVLPYFGVKNKADSEIDQSTFMSKTKAALGYYVDNIVKNNTLNAFYTIGYTPSGEYENNEGDAQQKNDAHFVELAAALSIINFMKDAKEMKTVDGRAENPVYREFGLEKDPKDNAIEFSDLGPETRSLIKQPLTQFSLFYIYIKHLYEKSLDMVFNKTLGLKNDFLYSQFYSGDLKHFFSEYESWLKEMSNDYSSSRLTFHPFDFSSAHIRPFNIIKGVKPKPGNLFVSRNYVRFDKILGKCCSSITLVGSEQNFTELFYRATESLYVEKFKN